MRKHTVIVAAVTFLAVSAGQAAGPKVTGVIARVERQASPTFLITGKGVESREVRTDDKTQYMKWITHKPWQQDNTADTKALVEGRCVEVELRPGAGIAKIVRISDEPSGSIFDPCKTRR
jgi:hypothetical protein